MPYTYKKEDGKYCVYKKEDGSKVGCTDGTKEALKKYMGALHSNEEDEDLPVTFMECYNKLIKDKKL